MEKSASNAEPAGEANAGSTGEATLLPVRIGESYGYIDTSGRVAIPPTFALAFGFSEGLAMVAVFDPSSTPNSARRRVRYGYIDQSGTMVIPPQFDSAERFSGGWAMVSVGSSVGEVLVRDASTISRTKGQWIESFFHQMDGKEADQRSRRYGAVDNEGRFVVNPIYLAATRRSEAAMLFESESSNDAKRKQYERTLAVRDRSGVRLVKDAVDARGEFEIYAIYHKRLTDVIDRTCCDDREARYGLRNALGHRIGAPLFSQLSFVSDDVLAGCQPSSLGRGSTEKCGFLDTNGRWLAEPGYSAVGNFSDGFAPFATGGRMSRNQDYGGYSVAGGEWGFFDRAFRVGIISRFSEVRRFSSDLAAVKVGEKWGYIDQSGTLVIQPQFESAEEFAGNHAIVRVGGAGLAIIDGAIGAVGTKAVIDRTGRITVSPQFSVAAWVKPGIALVEWRDGTRGYIRPDGSVIFRETPVAGAKAEGPPMAATMLGTGFFVTTEGHLLTSNHIVAECREVRLPSLNQIAQKVIADTANDIALLRIQGSKTPALRLRKAAPEQGESVIAYGFPLRGLLDAGGTITAGVISALSGPENNSNLIQITAPLQPGNSGGPVFDRKGFVVGMATAKLDVVKFVKAAGIIPENIGFAISGHVVKRFLDSAQVQFATDPWLSLPRTPEEVAAAARKATVPIACTPCAGEKCAPR
jgi:S1-C subfamily serine protease